MEVTYEKNLWVVLYNLGGGLQKPFKITYKKQDEFYSDRYGDWVFQPACDDMTQCWLKPEKERRGKGVHYAFFLTKEKAQDYYNMLICYRDFLKERL